MDTRKVAEFSRVATTNDRMARAMEDRNYQDGLMQQANMFRMMGNMTECQRIMEDLTQFMNKQRQAQLARETQEPTAPSVPQEVNVAVVPEGSNTTTPTAGAPVAATAQAPDMPPLQEVGNEEEDEEEEEHNDENEERGEEDEEDESVVSEQMQDLLDCVMNQEGV